ncbi:MAG: DUF5681 domain-containing protein [Hoeflea sp. D1-CHI-28]
MTHRDDDETPKPDYEVGYCRPPKDKQFKKGQSPNPTGRKRKPKSVREQIKDVLAQKIPITEGGKTKKLPRQQIILISLRIPGFADSHSNGTRTVIPGCADKVRAGC